MKTLVERYLPAGGIAAAGVRSLLIKIGFLVLSLGISIFFSRALGPDGFGVYSFVIALSTLLAIPCQVGLPSLVTRETARYQAVADWSRLRGLWRWVQRVSLLSAGVFALLAAALLWWVFDYRRQPAAVLAAALLVPLITLGNVRAAMLTGLRHVVAGQLPEFLLRPAVTLGAGAGLWWLWRDGFTAPAALLCHAGGAGAGFVLATMLRRSRAPAEAFAGPRRYEARLWWTAALPLALIGGMRAINAQIDLILLGVLRSDAEVGIYKVAVQGGTLVAFGVTVLNVVVAPHFARRHARGERAALQRLVLRTSRVATLLALPMAALFVLAGGPILGLVFGAPYRDGAAALALLSIGYLLSALWGPVATVLNMTGHERETLKGVSAAALVNVLLNIMLIPRFGMNGAAFSTLAVMLGWNLYLWHRVNRVVGIETFALASRRAT